MPTPLAIEAVDWHAGEASVRLEGGQLSGTGGINRLTGVYRVEGSRLEFGPIATTRMAGPPERMDSEQQFLADLAQVAHWSLDDDQLVLQDAVGAVVLRLRMDDQARTR
jgi:putative lipoprotein